jgi:hypothetical protein
MDYMELPLFRLDLYRYAELDFRTVLITNFCHHKPSDAQIIKEL